MHSIFVYFRVLGLHPSYIEILLSPKLSNIERGQYLDGTTWEYQVL